MTGSTERVAWAVSVTKAKVVRRSKWLLVKRTSRCLRRDRGPVVCYAWIEGVLGGDCVCAPLKVIEREL